MMTLTLPASPPHSAELGTKVRAQSSISGCLQRCKVTLHVAGLWIQNMGPLGPSLSIPPPISVLTCHSGFVPQGAVGSNGALSSRSPERHWQEPTGRPGGRQGPTPGSRRLPAPAPGIAAGASAGSPGLGAGEGRSWCQLQGRAKERQRSQQMNLETI